MLGFAPEPGKVAGAYVRVSTEDQTKGGVNLEAQEARLKQYAEIANWQLFKVYVDAGLSAGSTARPAFQEMLQDALANAAFSMHETQESRQTRRLHLYLVIA